MNARVDMGSDAFRDRVRREQIVIVKGMLGPRGRGGVGVDAALFTPARLRDEHGKRTVSVIVQPADAVGWRQAHRLRHTQMTLGAYV